MSEFTPGPWWLEDADASGHVMAQDPHIGEDGEVVTRYFIIHRTPGNPRNVELRANARLIAAAPDLYEALQIMVYRFETHLEGKPVRDADEVISAASLALRKARGETRAEGNQP